MPYSLQCHGLQNAKPPYLSVSPGVCSNSCPLSPWCHPSTSFSATLFFFYFQSFPASASFPMSQLFTVGGQSIGASVSASVLLMNIQGWFSLGLTGLISLQSSGFSRVFSSPTVQKQQFFSTQPSLWSNYHIPTWLLEKPQLWVYGHSYHAISQTYVVFAWEASSSSLSPSHHDEIPDGWPADFSFLSSPYSHRGPNPLSWRSRRAEPTSASLLCCSPFSARDALLSGFHGSLLLLLLPLLLTLLPFLNPDYLPLFHYFPSALKSHVISTPIPSQITHLVIS